MENGKILDTLPNNTEPGFESGVIVQEEMLESDDESQELENKLDSGNSNTKEDPKAAEVPLADSNIIVDGIDNKELSDTAPTSQVEEEKDPLAETGEFEVKKEISRSSPDRELETAPEDGLPVAFSPLSNPLGDSDLYEDDFTGFESPVPAAPDRIIKVREESELIKPAGKTTKSYDQAVGPFCAVHNITGNDIRSGSLQRLECMDELTRGLVYEIIRFVRYRKWKEELTFAAIKSLLPQPVSDDLIKYKKERLFGMGGVRLILSRSNKKKHLMPEFDKMPFIEEGDEVPPHFITEPEILPPSRRANKRSIVHTLISTGTKRIKLEPGTESPAEPTPSKPLPQLVRKPLASPAKSPHAQKKPRKKILVSVKGKKGRRMRALNAAMSKKLHKEALIPSVVVSPMPHRSFNTNGFIPSTNGHTLSPVKVATPKKKSTRSPNSTTGQTRRKSTTGTSTYQTPGSQQSRPNQHLENLTSELEEQKKINEELRSQLIGSRNDSTSTPRPRSNQEDEIIQIIEDKYRTDLNQLKEEHRETISVLENKFTEAVEMMESNTKKISDYLKEVHHKTIQTLEAKHEEIVENLEKKHDTVCYQLRKN